MKYESAYFGMGADCSVMLQQWEAKRGKSIPQTLVLAGVCRVKGMPRAGDYFWIGMQEWFRSLGDFRRLRCPGQLKGLLAEQMGILIHEIKNAAPGAGMELAGVMIVDEKLFLFGDEWGKWYLLQQQFGREVLRKPDLPPQTFVREYEIEDGATILLGLEDFFEVLQEREIAECMKREELPDESCMSRRLGELGKEAVCRGAGSPAAIILRGRIA